MTNSHPRDIQCCPLCGCPLLNARGHAIACACDEAERRGLALPDDRTMTQQAYRYAVTDYRYALRLEGLMP
jgi:hypothetical protein